MFETVYEIQITVILCSNAPRRNATKLPGAIHKAYRRSSDG